MIDDLIPFEKKLSAMITRDIKRSHPQSPTPERKKIINFFEDKDDKDFDFYGYGWKQNCSKNYKGVVHAKAECLKKRTSTHRSSLLTIIVDQNTAPIPNRMSSAPHVAIYLGNSLTLFAYLGARGKTTGILIEQSIHTINLQK